MGKLKTNYFWMSAIAGLTALSLTACSQQFSIKAKAKYQTLFSSSEPEESNDLGARPVANELTETRSAQQPADQSHFFFGGDCKVSENASEVSISVIVVKHGDELDNTAPEIVQAKQSVFQAACVADENGHGKWSMDLERLSIYEKSLFASYSFTFSQDGKILGRVQNEFPDQPENLKSKISDSVRKLAAHYAIAVVNGKHLSSIERSEKVTEVYKLSESEAITQKAAVSSEETTSATATYSASATGSSLRSHAHGN